jgi:hypothetical protein
MLLPTDKLIIHNASHYIGRGEDMDEENLPEVGKSSPCGMPLGCGRPLGGLHARRQGHHVFAIERAS